MRCHPLLDHSQTSSPSREKEQKRKGEGREIDGMGHENQAMEETPKEERKRHVCTWSADNWKKERNCLFLAEKGRSGEGSHQSSTFTLNHPFEYSERPKDFITQANEIS